MMLKTRFLDSVSNKISFGSSPPLTNISPTLLAKWDMQMTARNQFVSRGSQKDPKSGQDGTGETLILDRMTLKRRMETDLYEPNKKMRHSVDIDMS
ncbi:Ff.00g104060.m01.CDS01 [Fusarium sp. VM40]|nr:Ff.00g104060.m01.CDS01 [Fusarium sp. VM40]